MTALLIRGLCFVRSDEGMSTAPKRYVFEAGEAGNSEVP